MGRFAEGLQRHFSTGERGSRRAVAMLTGLGLLRIVRGFAQRRKGGRTGGFEVEVELFKRKLGALASLREKS
jgi:hypothetical protein